MCWPAAGRLWFTLRGSRWRCELHTWRQLRLKPQTKKKKPDRRISGQGGGEERSSRRRRRRRRRRRESPHSKNSAGAQLAKSDTNCQPCSPTGRPAPRTEPNTNRIFQDVFFVLFCFPHNGAHWPGYFHSSALLNVCDPIQQQQQQQQTSG